MTAPTAVVASWPPTSARKWLAQTRVQPTTAGYRSRRLMPTSSLSARRDSAYPSEVKQSSGSSWQYQHPSKRRNRSCGAAW